MTEEILTNEWIKMRAEGMTYEEIAEEYDVTASKVYYHVSKLRQDLEKKINGGDFYQTIVDCSETELVASRLYNTLRRNNIFSVADLKRRQKDILSMKKLGVKSEETILRMIETA